MTESISQLVCLVPLCRYGGLHTGLHQCSVGGFLSLCDRRNSSTVLIPPPLNHSLIGQPYNSECEETDSYTSQQVSLPLPLIPQSFGEETFASAVQVPNGALFFDAAKGALSYKDPTGAVHPLCS